MNSSGANYSDNLTLEEVEDKIYFRTLRIFSRNICQVNLLDTECS